MPFTLSREQIDDVERGAQDADWQPVKDAAKKIAFAEDRAVFEGYAAAASPGSARQSPTTRSRCRRTRELMPEAITQAVSELRLAGVDGPYSVLLAADEYTKVSETTEHGYPIREHIKRLIDGDIIWAPAIDGAFVLTTRGGDFELQIGQDLVDRLPRPRRDSVQLYFQESLTFLVYTAEASVALQTS